MQNIRPIPKPSPDDTPKMREAIERLNSMGIRFTRPSTHQLKIGDLSFYPGKGTIFRDGDPAGWQTRGLDALVAFLEETMQSAASKLTATSSTLDLTSIGGDV